MLKPGLCTLDRFLAREDHGDDVMLLSEFDGFIAGIVVCPDLLMPSDWLHAVWGEDGPVFESEREVNDILGLMMAHYSDVLRQLDQPGRYAPLLETDIDGSILWEMWATGFAKAVALRPEAWSAFTLSDDPAVLRAMILFRKLDELANRPSAQFTVEDDALDVCAPDLIPEAVEILHKARLALPVPCSRATSPTSRSAATTRVPADQAKSSRSAASTKAGSRSPDAYAASAHLLTCFPTTMAAGYGSS